MAAGWALLWKDRTRSATAWPWRPCAARAACTPVAVSAQLPRADLLARGFHGDGVVIN